MKTVCNLPVLVFCFAGLFAPEIGASWFAENMIDPEDGKMDISNYLSGKTGFFPVPIIITEPAMGFGLGAAVAYFHPPKEIDADEHPLRGRDCKSVRQSEILSQPWAAKWRCRWNQVKY